MIHTRNRPKQRGVALILNAVMLFFTVVGFPLSRIHFAMCKLLVFPCFDTKERKEWLAWDI